MTWFERTSIAGLAPMGVPPSVVTTGLTVVVEANAWQPVREYLRGLSWDGTARVERWIVTYLGTEDTAYTRAVGASFLVCAVARVMRPECEAETMRVSVSVRVSASSRRSASSANRRSSRPSTGATGVTLAIAASVVKRTPLLPRLPTTLGPYFFSSCSSHR